MFGHAIPSKLLFRAVAVRGRSFRLIISCITTGFSRNCLSARGINRKRCCCNTDSTCNG